MKTLKMKIALLKDCGSFKKYVCQVCQKNYFCYLYNGNYRQNFVVDGNDNDITNTKLGLQILLAVDDADWKNKLKKVK